MDLAAIALLAAYVLLGLLTFFVFLVGLHLSSRIDALYARQQEFEENVGYAVSCAWRYTEAVDDAATDGEGTSLYLSRLPGIEVDAGQHDHL